MWLLINDIHEKKKYDIAYHDYTEAKRVHQVQK